MKLFTKLMLCMVMVVMVAVTIITLFSIREQTEVLSSELISGKQQMAAKIADATKNAFQTVSLLFIERMLKDVGAAQDIVFCRILKPDGTIYLADKKQDYGADMGPEVANATEPLLDHVFPVTGERGKIIVEPFELGDETWKVVLGISFRNVEHANRAVIRHGMYLASAITVFAALVALVLSRGLTNPIAGLAYATEKIAAGDLEHSVEVGSAKDEVGALAESFNKMIQSLRISRKKLRSYSQSLEKQIAERRQAEEALQHQLGVEELITKELEEKTKELSQSNEELDAFVYTVSHDLKAPVVSLQGFSSLLMKDYEDRLDENGKMYIERIQKNSERMGILIDDLLELSRIGRIKSQSELVDISDVISDVTGELAPQLEESGAKLMVQDDMPIVKCDRTRISQIFANLISNASKFMGDDNEDPIIEVGYDGQGSCHTFYVRDNGIGIDKEYHETIFRIFQRLGDMKTEGTGVGLTIVKKIVENLGGEVWVDSVKGKGTTMYFTVPKAGDSDKGADEVFGK